MFISFIPLYLTEHIFIIIIIIIIIIITIIIIIIINMYICLLLDEAKNLIINFGNSSTGEISRHYSC